MITNIIITRITNRFIKRFILNITDEENKIHDTVFLISLDQHGIFYYKYKQI